MYQTTWDATYESGDVTDSLYSDVSTWGGAQISMMAIGTQSRLRSAFDNAAWEPQEWVPALNMLADECGASYAQLIGIGGPSMVMFNWISDHSEDVIDAIEDSELHDPSINYRILAGMDAPEREVVDEEDYAKAITKLSGDKYLRFVQRYSIQNGVQTNLIKADDGLIGLATLRGDRTLPEERRLFESIIPFAHTAVRVQAALGHQGARLIAGTYETMSKAAFVMDSVGQVQALTPAAEDALAASNVFRLHQKRLSLAHPGDDKSFHEALARALASGQRRVSSHSSLVIGANSPNPSILDVVTVPHMEWAMPFHPRAVVTLRRQHANDDPTALLCAAFGFTEAEAKVAHLLACGKTRNEIAHLRATSEETIKSHIKSIYSKADVSREVQLIAKVRDLIDGYALN